MAWQSSGKFQVVQALDESVRLHMPPYPHLLRPTLLIQAGCRTDLSAREGDQMQLSTGIHDVCGATRRRIQSVSAAQVDTAATEASRQAYEDNRQVDGVSMRPRRLRVQHAVEGDLLRHREDGQVACLAPSAAAGDRVPTEQSHAFCRPGLVMKVMHFSMVRHYSFRRKGKETTECRNPFT